MHLPPQEEASTNALPFLLNELDEQFWRRDGANLAKYELKKVTTTDLIAQEWLEQQLKGGKVNRKVRRILDKLFIFKEIKRVIRMTPNKALGPSGIRVIFFKVFVDLFVPVFVKIISQTLNGGEMSEFLLNDIINPISKKEDSERVSDMRPITLLEIPRKKIKLMTL